jgi:hypothetical protein
MTDQTVSQRLVLSLASQLMILEKKQKEIRKNLPLGEERHLKKKTSETTRDKLTVNHCTKYVEWKKDYNGNA